MDFKNSNATISMSIFERNLKFCLLVLLLFPSLCCTIFMLYNFNRYRYHNQIYGILLIVNMLFIIIELPFTLVYLYQGFIPINKCIFWIFINYLLSTMNILLMTWTSIERYLFIYHEQFIRRNIVFLHYFPIMAIIIYSIIYYISSIIFNTCQPKYNKYLYVCGGACYQYEPRISLIDVLIHGIGSVLTIFLINFILILRHRIHSYRRKSVKISRGKHQQWRRSLKMTVQLLSVSILYFIVWIPYTTIVLLQMINNTPFLTYLMSTYIVYLPYLLVLFLPFICLWAMPESKKKFFSIFSQSRRSFPNDPIEK